MIGSIRILDHHDLLRQLMTIPENAYVISIVDKEGDKVLERNTAQRHTFIFDDWLQDTKPDYVNEISDSQADKIIDLILRCSETRIRYPLYIQCMGGSSRSAAVAEFAAWIAEKDRAFIKTEYPFLPNPRVKKKLDERYKKRVLGGAL